MKFKPTNFSELESKWQSGCILEGFIKNYNISSTHCWSDKWMPSRQLEAREAIYQPWWTWRTLQLSEATTDSTEVVQNLLKKARVSPEPMERVTGSDGRHQGDDVGFLKGLCICTIGGYVGDGGSYVGGQIGQFWGRNKDYEGNFWGNGHVGGYARVVFKKTSFGCCILLFLNKINQGQIFLSKTINSSPTAF